MVAAIRGLNARSLRPLELTQAAWRRDRFDKLQGGLRELSPGDCDW
jgi:hypothetical protein